MKTKKFSILAVDDEATMLKLYGMMLCDYQLTTAASLNEAEAMLQKQFFHLVLLDLGLPDGSGMELLDGFHRNHPRTDVIVITTDATAESGVLAMKHGARDYILKPFDEEVLTESAARIYQEHAYQREIQNWEEGVETTREPLLGNSPQMRTVKANIEKAAESDAPVLIDGESGTGKELVARAIHARSQVCDGSFVDMNCGGFSEGLINSELFGHEKGAFTGASQTHKGCFEQAEGGTLFLDELCSLPMNAQ
ncbi:MAG: sigma-54-dependent transcriptional regulator, partial [Planctomycetota bacterium]